MGPCNQSQPVVVVEGLGNILPKSIACSSGTYPPSTPVIGITPEQIAHRPFMRDFLDPVDPSYVVQGVYARGKASVQAEYLIVNERC